MAERVALYVLWALLGTAASFVAIYAFTPLGLPFLPLVAISAAAFLLAGSRRCRRGAYG